MPSNASVWLKRIEDRRDSQARRRALKEWAVAHMGGKCSLCGYDRCIRALEFHHPDPGEKDFDVSSRLGSAEETLTVELEKCVIVCSNCHREIHDGFYPRLYVRDGDSGEDPYDVQEDEREISD